MSEINEDQIIAAMSSHIETLLGDDSISLARDTKWDEIPNFDSSNYVNFIVLLEIEYDITFGVADVEAFANIGDIVDSIMEHAS